MEYALKSDHETGGWTLMGDASHYLLSKERQVVLDCLKEAPGPMTPKAIARDLGRTSDRELNTLYKLLHDMLLAEQILSPARGYYIYPYISKDSKDGKDGKDGKDSKDDQAPPADSGNLTDLTGGSKNGKEHGKDGSPDNPRENSSNLTDLTDLTDLALPTCLKHGEQGMFWEEGGTPRCGLCYDIPLERIELLRQRRKQ